LNSDTPCSSKYEIAGSDASDGVAGFTLKFVGTFTLCVDIAYRAPDALNTPACRVDDASIHRVVAPSTDTNSNRSPPFTTSPSTS